MSAAIDPEQANLIFYSQISMTPEEYQQLPEKQKDALKNVCFYCETNSEWLWPVRIMFKDFQVYRRDPAYFPNP